MKFYHLIPKEKVISTALSLITSAQKEILVTMDVNEELKNPLPKIYHQTLAQKCQKGALVKRIGFGNKKAYKEILKVKPKYSNFIFIYGGSLSKYQRLIISDRIRAVCKIEDLVLLSDFKPFVTFLVKIFKNFERNI